MKKIVRITKKAFIEWITGNQEIFFIDYHLDPNLNDYRCELFIKGVIHTIPLETLIQDIWIIQHLDNEAKEKIKMLLKLKQQIKNFAY